MKKVDVTFDNVEDCPYNYDYWCCSHPKAVTGGLCEREKGNDEVIPKNCPCEEV